MFTTSDDLTFHTCGAVTNRGGDSVGYDWQVKNDNLCYAWREDSEKRGGKVTIPHGSARFTQEVQNLYQAYLARLVVT